MTICSFVDAITSPTYVEYVAMQLREGNAKWRRLAGRSWKLFGPSLFRHIWNICLIFTCAFAFDLNFNVPIILEHSDFKFASPSSEGPLFEISGGVMTRSK
jgi:hypothetical protein